MALFYKMKGLKKLIVMGTLSTLLGFTDIKAQIGNKKQVLEDTKENLIKISDQFRKQEKQIGKEIVGAVEDSYKQEKKQNTLDFKCPECKKGNLIIKYSPRFKRHFMACDSYPECKTTFTLPPNGLIKQTEKICEHCNYPMLMRISRGKRISRHGGAYFSL